MEQEEPSAFERLRYYRDEARHEFNLLGQRIAWFTACQSFLVVPYAICMSGHNVVQKIIFPFMLGAVAIVVSLYTNESVEATVLTINEFLLRERNLVETDQKTLDFAILKRSMSAQSKGMEIMDRLLGLEDSTVKKTGVPVVITHSLDDVHYRSLKFVHLVPNLFVGLWIGLALLASVSAFYGDPPSEKSSPSPVPAGRLR